MKDTDTNSPARLVIDRFRGPYEFLSNFYTGRPVTAIGAGRTIVFPSAEHFYQWYKTQDRVWKRRILEAATPREAKRLGRQCPLQRKWEELKVPLMRIVLRWKFEDPLLAAKLLSTDGAELVEGNHHGDTFWGVCGGEGENWLGRLLMERRDLLRYRRELARKGGQAT